MKGLIFNVERYSLHNGPGIRVTFFMKGCPLSCWWCHNPEGISPDPETVEQIEKIGETEFIKKEEAGKYYSTGDILQILERERIFISESGGGVTFSGGEPLLQPEFLLEALTACKAKGYHTAVDTCGYADEGIIEAIIPFTDLFLYDLKHSDDTKHLTYTGVSNLQIISNLNLLLKAGRDLILRIPVVPGFNDDMESLDNMKQLIMRSNYGNLKGICLLPYHKTGISKYTKFKIVSRMSDTPEPGNEKMNEIRKFFEGTGITVKVGG
ncbi:MAG: glycyl-radical enzyme activating protein [Bacteroidales bacterium]|nr:glycyl-radical enzyme activating protein [Bacteroidales bacterium]